jgi:hypothetical protein
MKQIVIKANGMYLTADDCLSSNPDDAAAHWEMQFEDIVRESFWSAHYTMRMVELL